MPVVKAFLRQAEEILDIAVAGDTDAADLAILIDRQGGMRMLDPKGWSLPALYARSMAPPPPISWNDAPGQSGWKDGVAENVA